MAEVESRTLPPNLNLYIKTFTDDVQPEANKERIGRDYYRHAIGSNSKATAPFAQIEGDPNRIDTALEWLYVSNYHVAVRDIRSDEAKAILPADNPKLVDQIIGAETLRDIQIARFLGNTETLGRYEGGLKIITDRGNVTRAEIETYYRNNIRALVSQVVDEEFKKTRGGYVPYDVYVNSGHGEIIEGIKDIITKFFIDPNANTYAAVYITANHFSDQVSRGFSFAKHAGDAYDAAVRSLSPELMTKLNNDMLKKTVVSAEVLNDPTVKRVTQNVTLKFN